MLRLLTVICVVFNAVVLAQAQTVAPGPAAPGGPYPYGVGPGGTSVAPGSGGSTAPSAGERSTAPTSVTPDTSSESRAVSRRSARRSSVSDAGTSYVRRRGTARHRRCWRCGHYDWAYTGGYYLWPAPYYAGGSERRFYDNYARWSWGPPYVGGYLAEIAVFRAYGR